MIDTIFLNPLDEGSFAREYALGEIIRMIDTTTEPLRIAIAYFTYPDIANALIKRTKDRKETRIILNTSDILRPVSLTETEIVVSKNLIKLLKLGSPLDIQSLGFQSKTNYSNMHHKFMISSNKVIFGSLNWTRSALHKNFEVIVISDLPQLIDSFLLEFNSLWEQSQIFFTPNGKIRMIMCPICKSSEGVDFESFGPYCIFCQHKFRVV